MSITDEVSHDPIGWLNAVVPEAAPNIATILVTDDVTHDPIGWLNSVAPKNIKNMLSTDEVSQEFMFSLKLLLLEKRLVISV